MIGRYWKKLLGAAILALPFVWILANYAAEFGVTAVFNALMLSIGLLILIAVGMWLLLAE
jgi:hypothetical protein